MSRLSVASADKVNSTTEQLMKEFTQRIVANPPGVCPVDMQLAFLKVCHAQTCGKCVPCRVGLGQLERLLEKVLDNEATMETLELIEETAENIKNSADCAIGFESARMVLAGLEGFREDYISHITDHRCLGSFEQPIPCVTLCPAHVDIPGYIALAGEGRCEDAVRLIRKDNPFPTACAMVCEHPCEERCRRKMLESPINIRALKKYAVDMMPVDKVATPKPNPSTGKSIGVIGGGPAGLTAAYFLALMGHKIEVYETHDKLGGMLRYGIPNYRFPKDRLDEDIRAILNSGDIHVTYNTTIGKDIPVKDIYEKHDAIFVGIGAQTGKTLRIEGADAGNVVSAVDILDQIGNGNLPDYTGKSVVVIGGGNVAMDCARSAVRCNAEEVSIIYRRRQKDMTALESEIESAVMEGIALVTLQAPIEITKDENGNCKSLITQPQMISAYRGSRPAPKDAAKEKQEFKADVIMIAVGQDIVSAPFEEFGIPAKWNILQAGLDTQVKEVPGVFTGGDCATGPSTVIRAIAAGKVAAHNIDEYLGYHHTLTCEAVVPEPKENMRDLMGRTEIGERPANIRKKDFEHVEELLTHEEAMQEACRCLRCDHFGCGAMVGGRDL